MKSLKVGTIGKVALIGGAGLIGLSLLNKSGIFDSSSGQGSIGGSDGMGGGDLSDVSDVPINYVQNNYYQTTIPTEQFMPEAITQSVPTFQDLAVVNRNIMFDNGLADSGYSTAWGEVFLKDGVVVGGTDVINGQSITPQGVADREAKANNPFSKFYAPEQLMSVDPNQLQSVAPAGNNKVSPFTTVAEVGLAGATLIPSPATKFGENLFSSAKPIIKEATTEVGETGIKSVFKYTAKQGAKAVPFVGLGAGVTLDSTGAFGGKKYPVGVAVAGNVLGDILGGVGATLTSPLALTGAGAVVPIGAGIGGQIVGEQIVYAPYNWLFRKDEEKDDLQEQVAYAEPPALLMSPSAINMVSSSSRTRSSSSPTPMQSTPTSLSGVTVQPTKTSSSSSKSSSKSSSSSSKSSSSSSAINTTRFVAQSGGGYSDNVAKQSVSKEVAQSRSSSSLMSYATPKTSSAPKSYSSYSTPAPKQSVSKPAPKTVSKPKSFVSKVSTKVTSIFKKKKITRVKT